MNSGRGHFQKELKKMDMLANLYLHPSLDVADAAIAAYVNHGHLVGPSGRVRIVSGRDRGQYEKAKKVKALRTIATALTNGHTINPST